MLINIYYSFLSVFLNQEGITIPLIGVILTVALLPAVSLEVPMGNWVDSHGVRKGLVLAATVTAVTGIMIPLFDNFYYSLVTVTAFTVSYTMIFITLYSRMSDVISRDRVTMTGAIATFKDLGYTIGPLAAGPLIELLSLKTTFLLAGGAFALLVPIGLVLHD
jgi:MFS family permease